MIETQVHSGSSTGAGAPSFGSSLPPTRRDVPSLDRDAAPKSARPLFAALAVGIAGDYLLRGGDWRLGFFLWILLGVGVALSFIDRAERERRLLLLGVAAAAWGFVWRDSELLYTIDLLSLLCMGALVIWHGSGKRIADLTVVQAARAALLAVLTTLGGAPSALREGLEASGGTAETSRRVRALAIGTVIAVPPIWIVAMLLSGSDRMFGDIVQATVDFLSVDAIQHGFIIVLLTWFVSGWLRAARGEPTGVRAPEVSSPGAPFLTLSVGLYGLVALLALFLGTQARALFGGASYLQAAAGLTVAEYARDGFFEMVAASGIVVATLVAAEWLLTSDDQAGRRRFGAVGTVLVLQVSAILASALVRMGLYVREFGLTVDRSFALSVMVLIAAALVVVATTTLRERAIRFAPAMLGVTIAWVMMLDLVNLEATVVRVNAARAADGAPFDARYHAVLSADALPALREAAGRLSPADCSLLATEMRTVWDRRRGRDARDWRSANLPMMRAMDWWAETGGLSCARNAAD